MRATVTASLLLLLAGAGALAGAAAAETVAAAAAAAAARAADPAVAAAGHPVFDRLGLAPARVPPGAVLVRAPGDLPDTPGLRVHAQRGDQWVVTGDAAALASLTEFGARTLPAARIPARTAAAGVAAPASVWPMPAAADPAVRALVDSVTWARVRAKISALAAFPTRYSTSPYNAAAAETLKAYFTRLGLTVQDHTFAWGSYTLHNIVATQPGTTKPDSIFVIGAHYDDMPSTGTAPGADDNASGVAAVMTAAELFAGRRFQYTVKYACFGGEEQGTNGSEAWAAWARAQNLAIVAMLNFDMIGWWTTGVDFDLEVEVGTAMTWLSDVITGAAALYTTMPCEVHVDDGAWWGDHYPFWQQGYHAANHEEAWDWGDPDFNPSYHTSKDTVARLSADYAVGCTKVAVATLATLATLDPLSGAGETPPARPGPTLAARPNPFNPRVVLTFTVPRAGPARLTVHDLAGRLVAAPVDGVFPAGRHETSWDGRDAAGRGVPAGVYVARLASPDGTATRRLVLAR